MRVFAARSELRKVLFLAPSVCGLRGCANSHGRRVWSLARMSLKVKVKGQGRQKQKTAFFGPFGGLLRFMFGKTSSASSVNFICTNNHTFVRI